MPNPHLPQRRQDLPLSSAERQEIISSLNAVQGPARSFVSELAQKALNARGRLDDDVYGIVKITLEALSENRGLPPPLIFAVTHYQTGKVEQVGFLPKGFNQVPPGGRFVSNDPRFKPKLREGTRRQIEE